MSKACPDCHAAKAQYMAKKIADEINLIMERELRGLPFEDDKGFFQGQVCHLLSAYMMSYSIKILKMNKMPEKMLDALYENVKEMAIDFAEFGRFKKVVDH